MAYTRNGKMIKKSPIGNVKINVKLMMKANTCKNCSSREAMTSHSTNECTNMVVMWSMKKANKMELEDEIIMTLTVFEREMEEQEANGQKRAEVKTSWCTIYEDILFEVHKVEFNKKEFLGVATA